MNARLVTPKQKILNRLGRTYRSNVTRKIRRRDARIKPITNYVGIAILAGRFVSPEEAFSLQYGYGNRENRVVAKIKRLTEKPEMHPGSQILRAV